MKSKSMASRVCLAMIPLLLVLSIGARAKEKVVVLWPAFSEEKTQFGLYLKEAFEAEHPDVTVDLLLDPQYSQKLPVMVAAGSSPDVTWIGASGITQAATGIYSDLTELVKRDSATLNARDYFPVLWDDLIWQGKRWGLPLAANPSFVYYNRDLFQARGLADPQPNWTFADVARIARSITSDSNGDGTPDVWGVSLQLTYGHWIFGYGGKSISNDGKTSLFNNPYRLEAYRNYDMLNKDPYGTPNDAIGNFLRSALGMSFAGVAGTLAPIRAGGSFDWDVTTWPYVETTGGSMRNTTYTPEYLVVPTGAPHLELGWQFIKWATSPNILAELTRRGHIFPSRISVAASRAWINPSLKPAHINLVSDSLAFAVPHIQSQHPAGTQMNNAIAPLLTAFRNGTAPIQTAFEQAHAAVQRLLDEYNAQLK